MHSLLKNFAAWTHFFYYKFCFMFKYQTTCGGGYPNWPEAYCFINKMDGLILHVISLGTLANKQRVIEVKQSWGYNNGWDRHIFINCNNMNNSDSNESIWKIIEKKRKINKNSWINLIFYLAHILCCLQSCIIVTL